MKKFVICFLSLIIFLSISGCGENARLANEYIKSLKVMPYDQLKTMSVQLDENLKAEITVTEVSPNQKKVDVAICGKDNITGLSTATRETFFQTK